MATALLNVDLYDIDTQTLVAELVDRGYVDPTSIESLITTIYEKRKLNQDFTRELDDLIYNTIGRI